MSDAIRTILIVVLIAAAARADRITLRDGAGVAGPAVKLADVAELEGERATALAEVVVGEFAGESTTLSISRAEIQRALEPLEVNWGLLTLGGPQRITVERHRQPVIAQANPLATVDAEESGVVASGRTLKQLVAGWVEEASGRPAEELKIEYVDASDTLWATNEADGRIELEADTARLIGRVPFTVRQYRGGELIVNKRVAVDVAVRRAAVVAVATIHRGQTITGADVRDEVQWLSDARTEPVSDAAAMVGQTALRVISQDAVIEAGDVGPRALVKRGDLVTVRVICGGVVVKTIGRAAEDGQAGQIIEVRHLKGRDVYHVQVTGPREAVMLIDGQGAGARHSTADSADGGQASVAGNNEADES